MPDGTTIARANTPGGQGLFGARAQPNNPTNYHTYLNVMMQVAPSAYAYALQERMGKYSWSSTRVSIQTVNFWSPSTLMGL